MQKNTEPAIDAVADDVASLRLDLLMRLRCSFAAQANRFCPSVDELSLQGAQRGSPDP
jgi:formate dehydrogenase maturation protein FdhE